MLILIEFIIVVLIFVAEMLIAVAFWMILNRVHRLLNRLFGDQQYQYPDNPIEWIREMFVRIDDKTK